MSTLEAVQPGVETDADVHELSDRQRQRALQLARDGAPLSAVDMAAIFQISVRQFHKFARRGRYAKFALLPKLGPRSYSGVLVDRYLQGEALYVPTFGRKRRV